MSEIEQTIHDEDGNADAQAAALDLIAKRVLCGLCMRLNRPIDPFCRACGAPIGRYAAYGAFEHIHVMGFGLRRATSRPVSRLTLIAMWLMFGPTLLLAVLVGLFATPTVFMRITTSTEPVRYEDYHARRHAPVEASVTVRKVVDAIMLTATVANNVLGVALYGAILWKVTRGYRLERRERSTTGDPS